MPKPAQKCENNAIFKQIFILSNNLLLLKWPKVLLFQIREKLL